MRNSRSKKGKRRVGPGRRSRSGIYGKNKTAKLGRLGLIWLGALIVIIAIAVMFRVWLRVGPRHIPADGFYSTVVVVGRQPVWLGLEAESGRMSLIMIPRNMWVELPADMGGYQAQAVWGVDKLKRGDGEVLKTTVANLLGLPVGGYMVLDVETGDWQASDWQNLRFFGLANLLRWQAVGRISAEGRMSVWDAYLIGKWWQQAGSTQKQTLWLDQVGSNLVTEDKLADGQTILRLNESAFDNEISGYFWPTEVNREQAAVGVKNAGGGDGAAGRYGRLLANMGFNVVEVGNATERVEGIVCRVSKVNDYPASIEWLEKLTGCRVSRVDQDIGRVDLMVMVGVGSW